MEGSADLWAGDDDFQAFVAGRDHVDRGFRDLDLALRLQGLVPTGAPLRGRGEIPAVLIHERRIHACAGIVLQDDVDGASPFSWAQTCVPGSAANIHAKPAAIPATIILFLAAGISFCRLLFCLKNIQPFPAASFR